MQIIDGKEIAEEMLDRLRAWLLPKKFLGAVLVGDDKSSVSFLEAKRKGRRKSSGVDFRLYRFPVDIRNDELRREVR